MLIREMKKEDLEGVMELWLDTNKKAHFFISEKYWEDNFEYVKSLLPNTEIYIAESRSKIIGFIGIDNEYIAGIFVLEQIQAKGVGTKLLLQAKKKYNRLILQVYTKNKKAIEFYKKEHFTIDKISLNKDTKEEEYTMIWKKI